MKQGISNHLQRQIFRYFRDDYMRLGILTFFVSCSDNIKSCRSTYGWWRMIASWLGSIDFVLVIILYILLSLGLPLGDFAMGGKHRVLPWTLRLASVVSVFVQIIAIVILLQLGHTMPILLPSSVARAFGYFFTIYLTLNTIMNLMSKSKKEKFFMTPLSLMAAICFAITTFTY
jgi:hypothetical protein